jgi:hypothetical protein
MITLGLEGSAGAVESLGVERRRFDGGRPWV